MEKKRKNIVVLIILIVLVVSIILLINYIKANSNSDEKTMKCIASKSLLIVSKTCSACVYQKQILENYIGYFNITDIIEHPEIVEQYNLIKVPTWIIERKKYTGVKTLEELKKITDC